jgi:DNA phosphorothioation-associated putative methyltransferase
VVNLGYVINVIEDPRERAFVLRSAWMLTTSVLVVAGRLLGEADCVSTIDFADGSLTSRQTFQKFYDQQELKCWVESELKESAIAAAPGIFYVFRDAEHRERFVASRYRRAASLPTVRQRDLLYDQHRSFMMELEVFFLDRGRQPSKLESLRFDDPAPEGMSIKQACHIVRMVRGSESWDELIALRRRDLTVYLALEKFNGRTRWSDLSSPLQLDIRAFFGTYSKACRESDDLLFAVGRSIDLNAAIRSATVGKQTPSAIYAHRSCVSKLPPILCVYEGCGRVLAGEVVDANVVKLNRLEPKISYLSYPDFDKSPHPVLTNSVIVHPGKLKVIYRDYQNRDNPPILHRKEEFVDEEYPGRSKFARLTKQEERLGLFEETDRIGTRQGWEDVLSQQGVRLNGHRAVRCSRVNEA